MSPLFVIAGFFTLVVFIYLVYALLKAEEF